MIKNVKIIEKLIKKFILSYRTVNVARVAMITLKIIRNSNSVVFYEFKSS